MSISSVCVEMSLSSVACQVWISASIRQRILSWPNLDTRHWVQGTLWRFLCRLMSNCEAFTRKDENESGSRASGGIS